MKKLNRKMKSERKGKVEERKERCIWMRGRAGKMHVHERKGRKDASAHQHLA